MKRERSFMFGVPVGDHNFIGREKEIRRLRANFLNGINSILISPRRWGKTSLVDHVRNHLDTPGIVTVYVDAFACRSEYDFYNALAGAIMKQTASQRELWLKNIKDFLLRIVPKLTYSPETYTDFSVSLGITPNEYSPEELLQLAETVAEKKDIELVICIDEFQKLGEFQHSLDFQRRLRSVWQHQKRVSYCLYGSQRHMMMDMFQRRNMPFYQFGDTFFLERIEIETWVEYIVSRYQEAKHDITPQLASEICQAVECHSSYVQQLAWLILTQLNPGEAASIQHLQQGIEDLLDANEMLFLQQISQLTTYQMNFLRAMSAGIVDGFNTRKVINQFNLGSSSSNITRLKQALIDADLIEPIGKKMQFTDPVFARWFKRYIAKQL